MASIPEFTPCHINSWMIAGVGMLMLAFVFQTLAERKPHLDSGVFIYAKAGFGNYLSWRSLPSTGYRPD